MTDSEDSKPEIEKEEEEEEMDENKASDAEKEEEGDKSNEEKEEKEEEEKKEYKKKDVKQETSVSKKPSTPAKKAPKKAGKKEKSDDEESGSEEDDDDDEQKVGIYDKPVVLEEGAKRERKKVERLSATFTKTEEKPFEVPKGKGISLGECGFIDFKLNRTLADDLKPLHRLIFKRAGSAFEIKKNLRKFSGFPFGKNDKEYESRKNSLNSKSYTTVMIKFMCDVLDIPRSGKKEEMIDRLMEFLLKPTDSGRKVPKTKRKGKSDEKKKGSKRKTKGNKPEGKKKKKKEGDEKEEEEEDEEEEEEEEENEEEEEEEEEEDESEVEEPPKKKAKVTKTPKKEKEEKKEKPKKKETKKAAKKAKIESTDEDESDESSDDEPLVKKSDGPPSNEEIREVIKKILDSANLEMVTMKTVVKDVFAKYPKHDLSDRKDFIKNTVRQLIS